MACSEGVHGVDTTITVWTLTVDTRDSKNSIATSVHPSDAEARQALFDNYDQFGNYRDRDDGSPITDTELAALIDGECLVVHIAAHRLTACLTIGLLP